MTTDDADHATEPFTDRTLVQTTPLPSQPTLKQMLHAPPPSEQQPAQRTPPPSTPNRPSLSHEERYSIYRQVKAEMSVAQSALTGLRSAEDDLASASKRLELVKGIGITMPFGNVDFASIIQNLRDVATDVSNAVNDLQRLVDGG